jgi:hypothetical protein
MSITNIQLQPGSIISMECGSEIDLFLRRILFSFNQMMFEDICKLFDCFIAYRENREYNISYARIKLDYWAEDKAFRMEDESANKDYAEVKKEIDNVKAPKFY